MPCTCASCRDHARTLGLARFPASRKTIHRAYRSAAKLWHPDRFAGDQSKIHEAEEQFKRLQAAYRELTGHNPEETEAEIEAAQEIADSPRPDTAPAPEPIPFIPAPGCYSVSNFPPQALAAAAPHLGLYAYAVAIVDLSGDGSFDRFFLLASHGVIVKDASGTISMLRYDDLGKMEILDREDAGRIGFWERIAGEFTGVTRKLSLDIFRRSGDLFCSLTGQVDDAAKASIYQYLSRKKRQHKA
jgi:hypothetical protein